MFIQWHNLFQVRSGTLSKPLWSFQLVSQLVRHVPPKATLVLSKAPGFVLDLTWLDILPQTSSASDLLPPALQLHFIGAKLNAKTSFERP